MNAQTTDRTRDLHTLRDYVRLDYSQRALLDKIDEMLTKEAMEAVFSPTPLDLLGIAELHERDPETAMRIATEAGRQFDRERSR
jgi:hypothetical protein